MKNFQRIRNTFANTTRQKMRPSQHTQKEIASVVAALRGTKNLSLRIGFAVLAVKSRGMKSVANIKVGNLFMIFDAHRFRNW